MTPCYSAYLYGEPCSYEAQCTIEMETGIKHRYCSTCAVVILHKYVCQVIELL